MAARTTKSTRKGTSTKITLYADEVRAMQKVAKTLHELASFGTGDAKQLGELSQLILAYLEKYQSYESTDAAAT